MLQLKGIEAIVFDLGGVIIDLDFQRSFDSFAQLSGKSIDDIKQRLFGAELLQGYERGKYNDEEFIRQVKETFGLNCADQQIEHAFLQLLLHIPAERIALIQALAKRYRVFILSNTSAIHYKEVNAILLRDTGHAHLDEVVEKVFLSYEMGLLKPHREIYASLLETAGLKPSSTLFLDDNEDNLKGAAALGIQTALVSPQHSILTLFSTYV